MFKKIFLGIGILFALVGMIFMGVFIAMQFGWLNVRGTIAERNNSLLSATPASQNHSEQDFLQETQATLLCKIHALANYAPETAKNIQRVYQANQDIALTVDMITIAQKRFVDTPLMNEMHACSTATQPNTTPLTNTAFAWADSEEWSVMKSAFIRDQEIIRRAAHDAGISPRLLLGGVIGEQFRFFTNSRDSFKRYFEPLKILASLSKFSFGIAGLKPDTAAQIEEHLTNPQSEYYLGPDMEQVITYPEGADVATTRFNRITDTKDPYYSYLYVGLFMRQIIAQWQRAGIDIRHDPEVLSTLYNLGFYRSVPKENPRAGGAPITVNEVPYNFGQLGYEFFFSGELLDEFPYEKSL